MRAARFALDCARTDFGYNMLLNGEFTLQRWILDLLPSDGKLHVIDVGANVGNWSRPFLDLAESRGRLDEIDLHAFEPCTEAFGQLARVIDKSSASLHRVALSDRVGETTLYVAKGQSELSSLYNVPGLHTADEYIATTTLDAYAQVAGLNKIDFLKTDAEGHDLTVLKGASVLLREGRISIIQFEYNDCWIYARNYLQDVYRLLAPLGYQLGKLTPYGIEFHPRWDPGLETFRGAMYVACRNDVVERLPHIAERHRLAQAQVV